VRDETLPKRPFRDSAIFNAVLALIVVGVAWFTGGELLRALLIALVFFVLATAWSWWRFRTRIDARREAEAKRQ
jgi:Flp pilus assembly protein TadB